MRVIRRPSFLIQPFKFRERPVNVSLEVGASTPFHGLSRRNYIKTESLRSVYFIGFFKALVGKLDNMGRSGKM
jgi:hypothetical protein